MTPAQIALRDLVATMTKLDELCSRGADLSEREDRIFAALEDRRTALEQELEREVMDKLGVDYGVLWFAVTPSKRKD